MKVTKSTGAYGGFLIAASILIVIAGLAVLFEPIQAVYANHKDSTPQLQILLGGIALSLVFSFGTTLAILMIKARAFTETEISVKRIFTSPIFYIWSAICIACAVAVFYVWFGQL